MLNFISSIFERKKEIDVKFDRYINRCMKCNIALCKEEKEGYKDLCKGCEYLWQNVTSLELPKFKSLCNEWDYIWCNSIQEKGVEWYIKARDKLIKKIELIRKIEERKDKTKKDKLIKSIEEW